MEKLNFNYSLKNIPIPHETSYLIKLREKIENVTKRMRWKALFFLNDDKDKPDDWRETFGFKSRKIPPSCKEMESFDKDFFNIISSIKFKTIQKSKNLFLFADKTSNLYETTPEK